MTAQWARTDRQLGRDSESELTPGSSRRMPLWVVRILTGGSEGQASEDLGRDLTGPATVGVGVARMESHEAKATRGGDCTHMPAGSNKTDKGAPRMGWKPWEDTMVVQMVRKVGKQWQLIASLLPDRTADSVRNRWYNECKSRLAACSDEAGADMDYDQLPRHVAAAPWVAPMEVVSMPMGAGVGMPMGGGVPVGGNAPMRASVPVATRLPTVLGSPVGTARVACMPQQPSATPRLASFNQIVQRFKWTPTEDRLILEGVETFGFQWRQVAALLPGRSDSSIRNRHKRLDSMRNRHTTSSDLADEGQLNSHCNFSHIMSDDQGQCPMIMDRIFLTVKATADASHSTTDLPIVDASAAYAQRSPAMPPVALPAPLVNAEAAQVQLGIPVCAFTYRVSAK